MGLKSYQGGIYRLTSGEWPCCCTSRDCPEWPNGERDGLIELGAEQDSPLTALWEVDPPDPDSGELFGSARTRGTAPGSGNPFTLAAGNSHANFNWDLRVEEVSWDTTGTGWDTTRCTAFVWINIIFQDWHSLNAGSSWTKEERPNSAQGIIRKLSSGFEGSEVDPGGGGTFNFNWDLYWDVVDRGSETRPQLVRRFRDSVVTLDGEVTVDQPFTVFANADGPYCPGFSVTMGGNLWDEGSGSGFPDDDYACKIRAWVENFKITLS